MKTTWLLLAVPAVLLACAKKPDDPRLEFVNVGFVLHLPPAMKQALDSLAPRFQMVKINSFRSDVAQAAAQSAGGMQGLFATITDLDGDGTQDAVVEGATPGDSALRVIAVFNGAKPRAVDVVRYPVYDADAVGIYLSRPTGSKAGTFQVVNYPDSSFVYEFRDGRFAQTRIGN